MKNILVFTISKLDIFKKFNQRIIAIILIKDITMDKKQLNIIIQKELRQDGKYKF